MFGSGSEPGTGSRKILVFPQSLLTKFEERGSSLLDAMTIVPVPLAHPVEY